MIRLLDEQDRAKMVALLEQAPYLNLYLLGNLESVGFDRDFCEFWGDFADDELRGVLNRYFQGWVLYGLPTADWAGLAAVLDAHPVEAERLQDNPGGIPSILPYLTCYAATKVAETQLMDLDAADFRPQPVPPGVTVRRAVWADLEPLVKFYTDAEHMTRTRAGVERPLQDTRIWLAEVEGEPASAALTNAETTTLAMVSGVYTQPVWRGRGLSKAVCSALCRELLSEGRRPVLYWQEPAAGAVYRRLGFRPWGIWRSVRLVRRDAPGAEG
jgi:predicted GNAT family acetyltransferase